MTRHERKDLSSVAENRGMGKPQGPSVKAALAGRRPYWTAEEDAQLVRLVKKYGTKNWGIIAKELHSPIPRKGKSCRSRWMHQLNPCIKHEPFSVEEERILMAKQREFGNKWSKIAAYLPGRTDNAIKNHWHGHVKRRLLSRLDSSDEDDVMLEMKHEEPWNDMTDLFPVPLLRTRLSNHASTFTAQQDIECARTLLQLAQREQPPGLPVVKREVMSEEEDSESSKEPESQLHATASEPDKEENNSTELIQPDQQKLLSETLESAGLAHYSVLPLCPIKEEDIDSEQHVVIVLQSRGAPSQELPQLDSCSEGASVCVLQEDRSFQDWMREHGISGPSRSCGYLEAFPVSECSLYDPPLEPIRDLVNENASLSLQQSGRDVNPGLELLKVAQRFDSSPLH